MTPGRPRLEVLGDWGTSRLRLWRVAGGEIAATREGPGIAALTGSREERVELLRSLAAPWREAHAPLHVLLAGMGGSRNGLFEVPYAALPADTAAWARCARTRAFGNLGVTLAAGLLQDGEQPDVMRGEETQLFGALALEPALAHDARVFVMPGTHSKWIEAADGSIRRFRTGMTGELYALLVERSMLLRTGATDARDAPEDRADGFVAGVARAEKAGGPLSSLFEARAAQLVDERSAAWAGGFVSGLLIGSEINELARAFDPSAGVLLIGEPLLSSLYASAFRRRGIATRLLDGARCTIAGLLCLRAHLEES